MVDNIGFSTTFGFSTFIGIITAVILIFIVKDPLKRSVPSAFAA